MTDSRNDILNELDRILASKQFSGSNVLAEFLKFIVHETLERRGAALKEYTIGVQALRKESDFNPQIDGIVRIHAGRLRRALKEYYYEDGSADDIVISIPKGTYIPNFEKREQVPLSGDHLTVQKLSAGKDEDDSLAYGTQKLPQSQQHSTDSPLYRPVIVVIPFMKLGNGSMVEQLGNGIGEVLSTELTQFQTLRVVSYRSREHIINHPEDVFKSGSLSAVNYLLTGSVQQFNQLLQINVQLTTFDEGDQLWARRFETNDPDHTYWSFQEKVIDTTLACVAGLHGAIARHDMVKGPAVNPHGVCSLGYYYNQYVANFDLPTIEKAKAFYERVLMKEPQNALAMAFLSEISAGEELLMDSNGRSVERGLWYGHLAIRTDPYCQQAYQALAANMLLKGDIDYNRVLEQGLEINPRSADFKGAMAALLIYGGDIERGFQILSQVLQLNPYAPWWQLLTCSIYAYSKRSYREAVFWAERIDMDVVQIPIIKAASYAQMGSLSKAKDILNEVEKQYPGVSSPDRDALKKMFFFDTLIEQIMVGLEKVEIKRDNSPIGHALAALFLYHTATIL